jgi:hypothetical protein
MSWVFRKIFWLGPFRTTLSKSGVGMSFGIPCFKVGVSPTGRKYFSIGIPGTGLYFIKYFSKEKSVSGKLSTQINQNSQSKQNEEKEQIICGNIEME